jgi:hypothetical protein
MIPLIPLLSSSAKSAVTNYALKKISTESFFPSLFSKNILNPYGLLGNFSIYTVIVFILFAIIIYFIIRIILAKNPVSKSIQFKEKELLLNQAQWLDAEQRAETWSRRYNNLLPTTQTSFEE